MVSSGGIGSGVGIGSGLGDIVGPGCDTISSCISPLLPQAVKANNKTDTKVKTNTYFFI